ncbi:MAG TPA: radical SAM protein, partial [Acidimicrobiales bacterium]|nr:radical SAM protein [Acidimicrobiales bacterium]
ELPPGCSFCAWEQTTTGRVHFARLFDELADPDPKPDWPVAMEFALSNRCNLACVMCNGDFSSTIRATREGRPPLASSYGDAFFDQLRPFLPHLRRARFFGGEPFLIPEYQRIWDLMVEVGASPECNVTTNGTVLTPRVKATLRSLPFSIAVSVDGTTPETVEAVRVGADHGKLLDHVAWFRDHCERSGTSFWLTFCLMRHNWHEFADFLAWADQLGAAVAVNTVVYPPDASLFRLPLAELDAVLGGLEDGARPLDLNAHVWAEETDRLRQWRNTLADRGSGRRAFFEHWSPDEGSSGATTVAAPSRGPATPLPAGELPDEDLDDARVTAVLERLEREEGRPASLLEVDGDNVITAAAGPGSAFLGIPARRLEGQPFSTAIACLEEAFGVRTNEDHDPLVDGAVEHRITFRSASGRRTDVRGITLVAPDGRTATVAVHRSP